MEAMATVQFEKRKPARLDGGRYAHELDDLADDDERLERFPIGGDMKRGDDGCVVRLGKLRFCDAVANPADPADKRRSRGAYLYDERLEFMRPAYAPKRDEWDPPPALTKGDRQAESGLNKLIAKEELRDLRARLGLHADVLDEALAASTFADIGEAFGYQGKLAERRGKAMLIAACAALAPSFQNFAAAA